MLRDIAKPYYFDQDLNCAETVLRAASEMYDLGVNAEDAKLIAAFGAGMGCGKTCGALAGALSALGKMTLKANAHAQPEFRENCAKLVAAFEEALSSSECAVLMPKYKTPEQRCFGTVALACDVLEAFVKTL